MYTVPTYIPYINLLPIAYAILFNFRLTSFKGLMNMQSLTELYAGNNRVSNIREIFNLKVCVFGFWMKKLKLNCVNDVTAPCNFNDFGSARKSNDAERQLQVFCDLSPAAIKSLWWNSDRYEWRKHSQRHFWGKVS